MINVHTCVRGTDNEERGKIERGIGDTKVHVHNTIRKLVTETERESERKCDVFETTWTLNMMNDGQENRTI